MIELCRDGHSLPRISWLTKHLARQFSRSIRDFPYKKFTGKRKRMPGRPPFPSMSSIFVLGQHAGLSIELGSFC
jgi:hypothetical protein